MKFFAVAALAAVATAAPMAQPAPQGGIFSSLQEIGSGFYGLGSGILTPAYGLVSGVAKPAFGLVGSVTKPATGLIGSGFSAIGDLFSGAAASTPTLNPLAALGLGR